MSEELKEYSGSKKALPSGFEEKYILTNPMFYMTYFHLADYYANMKDYGRTYSFCQEALSKQVAGVDQKKELERLSQNSLKRSNHADAGN